MKPFDVDDFEPPGNDWRRRLSVLVMGSVAFLGVLALWPDQSTPRDAVGFAARTRVVAPAPTTSTTVSPQSIQAGVANFLAHQGPTPQELASVPASTRAAGGSLRHGRGGERSSHVR